MEIDIAPSITIIKELSRLPDGTRFCLKAKALISRCAEAIGQANAAMVLGINKNTVYSAVQMVPQPVSVIPSCNSKKEENTLFLPDGRPATGRLKMCVRLANRLSEDVRDLIYTKALQHFTDGVPIHIKNFAKEIEDAALEELGIFWNLSTTTCWRIMKGLGFYHAVRKQNPEIYLNLPIIKWREKFLSTMASLRAESRTVLPSCPCMGSIAIFFFGPKAYPFILFRCFHYLHR